jgi:GAF domain-containing protein
VRLLTTIAASLGTALENARLFDETQRLLKETEQRAAELAIINSIQQGLASELDFQAIVDLVGDKLREVFRSEDMAIVWYEARTNLMHYLYAYEHGARQDIAPHAPRPGGPGERIMQTRQPIVVNNIAEHDALGFQRIPGTDQSLSQVRVPILGSNRVLGIIAMENYEREAAYGEADVRLLTTVAASMGVALENARLLDETQRRTRETAALAEVGRDISSTLDLAVVMDRIAHHAKDLLHCDNSAIFLPDADGLTYHAIVAVGDIATALQATEIEVGVGIIGSLVQSGRAEFINDTGADPRGVQIAGTPRNTDERLMVAPLKANEVVKGVMAVWRTGGRPVSKTHLTQPTKRIV